MSKIKLSRSQWLSIGKQAQWIPKRPIPHTPYDAYKTTLPEDNKKNHMKEDAMEERELQVFNEISQAIEEIPLYHKLVKERKIKPLRYYFDHSPAHSIHSNKPSRPDEFLDELYKDIDHPTREFKEFTQQMGDALDNINTSW